MGISRVAVKARIQALEQRGIIEEYTTIINPQKISGAVSCYFEIETLPETLAEVTERLRRNETVTQIYRVTGRDKLHVHAVAASGEEMERLIGGGHRPPAGGGPVRLQHHPVPDQGHQGPAAVTAAGRRAGGTAAGPSLPSPYEELGEGAHASWYSSRMAPSFQTKASRSPLSLAAMGPQMTLSASAMYFSRSSTL